MSTYERRVYRNIPDTNDSTNWHEEYMLLNSIHQNAVDDYNWLANKMEVAQQNIIDYRDRTNKSEDIAQWAFKLVIAIRNQVGMLYRRKKIKDIDWLNNLLIEYKDKIHFDISPINADDYFTAKAVIEIDGKWQGRGSDMQEITNAIKNAISQNGIRNFQDTSILIDEIIVNELYHTDELSDTREG